MKHQEMTVLLGDDAIQYMMTLQDGSGLKQTHMGVNCDKRPALI